MESTLTTQSANLRVLLQERPQDRPCEDDFDDAKGECPRKFHDLTLDRVIGASPMAARKVLVGFERIFMQ